MDHLTQLSCEAFAEQLASAAPVPGGGGASALVGALGAALGGMVASLTLGKKKYADVQEDMQRLSREMAQLQTRLLTLVQQDAQAFRPLAEAYRMPVETPEQRAQKQQCMERVLKEACVPPMEMMEQSLAVLHCLQELEAKGSVLAKSDAGVGAALCGAAMQGAVLNIRINAASLQNRAEADALNRQADALMQEGLALADSIYRRVDESLRT